MVGRPVAPEFHEHSAEALKIMSGTTRPTSLGYPPIAQVKHGPPGSMSEVRSKPTEERHSSDCCVDTKLLSR
jgi:hypothetical protein